MFEKFKGTIREFRKLFGTERSSHWRKTRNLFVEKNPLCACCGRTKGLHVHHIVPFQLDPRLELIFSNLITLCADCHLILGHCRWWQSWNETVVEDATYMLKKIDNRPSK